MQSQRKKARKMKAWRVFDKYCECGTEIVFAETAGKAKSICLHDDNFGDYEYTELCARRFQEYDKYYDGNHKVNFWEDEEHRIILVRDFGWSCIDGIDTYCDDCPAKEWCEFWEEVSEE